MARRPNSEVERAISTAAQRWGIPLETMRAFARVESGFNPRDRTGSYMGLFQLSPSEFRRGGGQGSILDPFQNAMAAGRLFSMHQEAFRTRFQRDPSANELYMMHQQGWGGLQNHLRNPDRLAWENMAATAEGRKRDEKGLVYPLPDGSMGLWSQAAVAGNIPTGSNLDWRTATSRDFMGGWERRLTEVGVTPVATTPPAAGPDIDAAVPDMHPNLPDRPRDLSGLSGEELTRIAGPRQSPYEAFTGSRIGVEGVNDAIPAPVVPGVAPGPSDPLGQIFSNDVGKAIGTGLTAAGRAIAAGGPRVPQFPDPATALGSQEPWPAIPARPRRPVPGRG